MSQSCYYLKWHSAGHNDCKNEPKQHNAPVKTASCQKIWKSVCFHDNCQIYLYAFSYRFSCFMAGTTWYQKALLGSNKGWNSQHSASKHNLAKMTKSYDKEFDEKQELVSTSKNYLLMAMIAVVSIVWGANTSLPAPFYPKMAEEKGATPSQVTRFSTNIENNTWKTKLICPSLTTTVWVCVWYHAIGSLLCTPMFWEIWLLHWG